MEDILRIDDMISKGNYQAAIVELPSLIETAGENVNVSGVLLELLILVNCLLGDDTSARKLYFRYKECRKEGLANFRFTRSVIPIAESMIKERYREEALEIYQDGIKLAKQLSDQQQLNLFQQKINEVRQTIKEKEQFERSLSLGVDESTSSQSKKKKPPRRSKEKDKVRSKEKDKVIESTNEDGDKVTSIEKDKVIESTNEDEEKKVEWTNGDRLQEGENTKNIGKDESFQQVEFLVNIKISFQVRSKLGNYRGTVEDCVSLSKSFLPTDNIELKSFLSLQNLCSSHSSLLTVESVTKHESALLLVTEPVYDVDEYFVLKLENFRKLSNVTWWDFISNDFKVIFRDVIHGLMFLFSSGQACGNIGFGLYVTNGTRGRVLPSMKYNSKSYQKADVKALAQRMLAIMCLSSHEKYENCDSNLDLLRDVFPEELVIACQILHKYAEKVSSSFIIDLPFFWILEERMRFIDKLKRLGEKTGVRKNLTKELDKNVCYTMWHTKLHGVYQEVWDMGNPSNAAAQLSLPSGFYKVKIYRDSIDIIRYFGAVYKHANENKYLKARNYKDFTEEQMEKDLHDMFPTFYMDIFSSLCECAANRSINEKWLKLIASYNYDNDG